MLGPRACAGCMDAVVLGGDGWMLLCPYTQVPLMSSCLEVGIHCTWWVPTRELQELLSPTQPIAALREQNEDRAFLHHRDTGAHAHTPSGSLSWVSEASLHCSHHLQTLCTAAVFLERKTAHILPAGPHSPKPVSGLSPTSFPKL